MAINKKQDGPAWWDDSLSFSDLRQRERDFNEGKLALSKKQAEAAIEKFRNKSRGIDPARRFAERPGIHTTPALMTEIGKRAGIKSWWTKDETLALVRIQNEWEKLDLIHRDNCPNGIRARFEGQQKAFAACSTEELKTFEVLSIEEMRLRGSDARRLLRSHYQTLTNSALPIICEIHARLVSACEKVEAQIEADETALAVTVGFRNQPSNFLVAVVSTSWRFSTSLNDIGLIPTSPRSFMLSFPGGEEIFQ